MPSSEFRLHPIHRDDSEKYLVILGQGDIAVFDATDGSLATTNITAAAATYLASSGGPTADDMRAVSIADYTLILNRKVTAAVTASQASFTVTEVFDTWTKMTSRLPTSDQYFRTTVDDGGRLKGYYQYILDSGDNGFASWTRDTATAQEWRRASGKWNDASKNPMGFRIRFERQNITSTTGTYTHATRTYTQAGAFTSYTFDSGDELHVSVSGGTLPVGWYPIESRTDNNSVVFVDAGGGNVTYRDSDDETASHTSGNDTGLTADYTSVSASVSEDFDNTGSGTAATDMDDVAERLQTNLRTTAACVDAIIYWDDANNKFHIVSPFRGSDATVVDITDPDTGFDLSQSGGNKPLDFSDGTATAGTGSPTTDTDLIEDRWENVPAPGDGDSTPDKTTLPIQLVRTTVSPLVFDADVIEWKPRLTGTHETNPAPSIFIDQDGAAASITLSDIGFHRNRLLLAGDENIVFSQDGDFFNLFIEDADTIVDSDPIDRALSSDQVTLIESIVPYRKSLAVFTKSGRQFELNAPEAFTPNTVSVTESTAYNTTATVKPKRMHESLFFTGPSGLRTSLFEYRALEDSVNTRADDVSSHVNELMDDDIKNVVTHPNFQMVFVLPLDTNLIYVYQQFRENVNREQAAWTKWTFDSNYDIDDIAVIEDELFMLVHDTGENRRILEKINLADTVGNLDLSGGQSLPTA